MEVNKNEWDINPAILKVFVVDSSLNLFYYSFRYVVENGDTYADNGD